MSCRALRLISSSEINFSDSSSVRMGTYDDNDLCWSLRSGVCAGMRGLHQHVGMGRGVERNDVEGASCNGGTPNL